MSQSPNIATRLANIRETLKDGVRLVAVSKYHSIDAITSVYEYSQRIFAESRVQELVQKYEALKDKKDIKWHFIGHLQRNKVKYIAEFIDLIHSVDSIKLLDEIEKQASKYKRIIPVLLELKIAQESTKSGIEPKGLIEIVQYINDNKLKYKHIILRGIMAMGSNTNNTEQIRKEFLEVQNLFNKIRSLNIIDKKEFCELSMGMSSDYLIAMEYGATLVRIGSSIFQDIDHI